MNNFNRFQGKVAFIQGGSRGIGAAIVERLALEGASVAFTYVSSDSKAKALADHLISKGGKVIAIKADSTKPEDVRNAIEQTIHQFDQLDILINNSGVLVWDNIENLTMDDWEKTVNTNVRSIFVASQEAAKLMNKNGRIINISSTNAQRIPFVGGALYGMSKAALTGLVKALSRDLGHRGITVNNILPGPVDTDLNPDNGDTSESMKAIVALGRYGQAVEIAHLVAFIASDEASYITGADLMIDGGFSA
ncbi:3-oxoacyl-ACP reductase family protein [Photobacterium sp. TLY01]|uniref:3-oxoacyl-ACP reductase family protein n=1 Tax=Photobacterium sp. TLY01 TaxID=2907534 RepID=UPI001F41B9F1|nr:3-oxoacyl-ACP reductase family protein [Photobacterium sp. TLY01]UIP29879.1 3-oxoacyl-ACP reductase FabG [Photobacterium sp. TLY01]